MTKFIDFIKTNKYKVLTVVALVVLVVIIIVLAFFSKPKKTVSSNSEMGTEAISKVESTETEELLTTENTESTEIPTEIPTEVPTETQTVAPSEQLEAPENTPDVKPSAEQNVDNGVTHTTGSNGDGTVTNTNGEVYQEIPRPEEPVANSTAETFYDGSVGTISAEHKAYCDGLVRNWLNGGCTDSELEQQMIDYLSECGYNVNRTDSGKEDKFVAVDTANYYTVLSDPENVNALYYYGKCYTTGERIESPAGRRAYETFVSVR